MNTQYMNDDICYTHTANFASALSVIIVEWNPTQHVVLSQLSHQHRKGWLQTGLRAGTWLQIRFKFKINASIRSLDLTLQAEPMQNLNKIQSL